jgi:molybdopterin converting factor small subunit
MNITFKFSRPLSNIIGHETLSVTIATAATLQQAIQELLKDASYSVQQFLQDDTQTLRQSIVFMVNNQQVSEINQCILEDNDTIALLSPMAGG